MTPHRDRRPSSTEERNHERFSLDVKVLSVSYPPNEAALIWSVGSSDSGSARVRISYLLGNLGKSFNYRAVATRDETGMSVLCWHYHDEDVPGPDAVINLDIGGVPTPRSIRRSRTRSRYR